MRVVEARLAEGAGGSGREQSNSEDKLSRDMLDPAHITWELREWALLTTDLGRQAGDEQWVRTQRLQWSGGRS